MRNVLQERRRESATPAKAGDEPGDDPVSVLAGFAIAEDALLNDAHAMFAGTSGAAPSLVEGKRRLLRAYDPGNMQRIATICHWGRSGSVLFASFLDDHDDVLILPNLLSESIYSFLERYASLSSWQKLLAYPAFSRLQKGTSGDFFLTNNPDGDYGIPPEDYFAAVVALQREHRGEPCDGRESRAWFIRYLHVAYALALGRQAENPRPMIVVTQHWWNERMAAKLREDFPAALFLHTIRDPISAFDAWLEIRFKWQFDEKEFRPGVYPFPVFDAFKDLLTWDRAHKDTADRSCAVRFEDMHNEPHALMRRVANWLGIRIQPSLIESTVNGKPHVIVIKGQATVGSNPERAARRVGNLNALDRLLIFALLHPNFVIWRYPAPRVMGSIVLRGLIVLVGALIPSRMEILNIRRLLERQFLPAVASGRIRQASWMLIVILMRRARLMVLILRAASTRLFGNPRALRLV
jgi:hypothetical protein